MRSLTTFTGVSALALGAVIGFAAPASAQQSIRGQGATLPAGLYANWFNPTLRAGFTYSYNAPRGETAALTGSSAGLNSFESHSFNNANADFDVQFAGSDAILTTNNLDTYATSRWGQPIQLPSVGTPVTIAFNPNGLTLRRQGPTGLVSISGTQTTGPILYLTRAAYCGIFTGAITNWNHPRITQANGGVVATAPINVVVRSDGSGTTEIFSRHLDTVCDGSAAAGGYTFIDTRTSTPPSGPATGRTTIPWADFILPNTRLVPSGGSAGVSTSIANTQFSIGYVSPDFTNLVAVPAAGAGSPAPRVANLQNQSDINLNRTQFTHSPTFKNVQLGQVNIQAPANADSALVWGQKLALTDPQANNPTAPAAYPIIGFTFLNFYTCNPAVKTAGIRNIITYYTTTSSTAGSADQDAIRDGFAPLPTQLKTAVRNRAFSTGAVRGIGSGPVPGVCTL